MISGRVLRHKLLIGAAAGVVTLWVNVGFTKVIPAGPSSAADRWSYADIADLFADAPLVLRARITSAAALPGPRLPNGATRFYVEGSVVALIRGNQAVAPHLVWLADLLPDSRGKFPKLKKVDVLIAALPVAGRASEIRLAARAGQIFWTPALEGRVRALVTSATAADAPPAITGVTSAFHTAGTITGEGETQIFLSTVTKEPISLTVLTRPGQTKSWAFALGEIVDEAAAPPARDTLGWYRLACFLPTALPVTSTSELGEADAEAARGDYAFVMQALGDCERTRR